jgi:hypothetical protein
VLSARDNPFRMQRIQSRLRYEPLQTTWPALMQRLAAMGYRGAIVGPHGSGKTTLLEDIGRRLERQGRATVTLSLRADQRRWSASRLRQRLGDVAGRVVLFDGANHLPAWQWWLTRRWTGQAAGLLITAHAPGRLPTLIRTQTDPALLERLADRLLADSRRRLDYDASAVLAAHNGNVREALRWLYDRASQLPGD